jgi:hypothetical protein
LNVSEAHAASAVTVTVIPALIVTSSTDVGTDCPPQVAVLFQFPLTEAVRVASGASTGSDTSLSGYGSSLESEISGMPCTDFTSTGTWTSCITRDSFASGAGAVEEGCFWEKP